MALKLCVQNIKIQRLTFDLSTQMPSERFHDLLVSLVVLNIMHMAILTCLRAIYQQQIAFILMIKIVL